MITDTIPACHLWPPPRTRPTGRPSQVLADWQRGRCALCGTTHGQLVKDHCHQTHLVRGWLCQPCNTSEGMAAARPPFLAYRMRPPAVIVGITEPYDTPYGGWRPEPRAFPLHYAVPDDPTLAALVLAAEAARSWWWDSSGDPEAARHVAFWCGGDDAVQVLRRHREEQDERHAAMTAHLATLVNLPEWLRDES